MPDDRSAYPSLTHYIGGKWGDAGSGGGEDVLNPADESMIARLPHVDAEGLAHAVDAASDGFKAWRGVPAPERAAIMRRAAELIGERRDRLALVMTLEQGKPLTEAGLEWDRAADTLIWHADAAERIAAVDYPPRSGRPVQSSRPEPLGICLALTAWNFPAILPVRKIAPALAAGCSVILKAAEETPGSAVELVRALVDAGLPPGVVNLVFGDPNHVSRTLLARPEIRKVSFTGSVSVGRLVAGLAAPGLKRCTLELGGHAPAIVCADADIEAAAETLAGFKYRNAGQVCIAPSRFFVERAAYDRFVEAFVGFADSRTLGDGRAPETVMGPMANARRIEAMTALESDALERGATLAAGGGRHGNAGYFWRPTVLTEVPSDAQIMLDEPFGPIAPIAPFDGADEVVARANGLEYGLAAYIFTGDAERGARLADRIEAGCVAVNTVAPAQPDTPFGGIKQSGYGYEGGVEGIEAFLHKKLVSTGAPRT